MPKQDLRGSINYPNVYESDSPTVSNENGGIQLVNAHLIWHISFGELHDKICC